MLRYMNTVRHQWFRANRGVRVYSCPEWHGLLMIVNNYERDIQRHERVTVSFLCINVWTEERMWSLRPVQQAYNVFDIQNR